MFDQFYGLKGRPFQLTPDPAFYFDSLTHRQALSYLGYGLSQQEGFIVITGEVGAGKTMLVQRLMDAIDPALLNAARIVTTQLGGDSFVALAAEAFGIDTRGRDKASVLAGFEAMLHDEARAGRRCLLIVDEAQNLPVPALEELRMLSNFQLGASPLLQIFLLGQPEFRVMIDGSPELEQLRQRVIATHHLGPMEADEVAPYVRHRLGLVGWSGDPGFDEDVFPAIHAATGGIPRKINALMSRLLLMGAVEETHHIDAALVAATVEEMAGPGFDATATLASKAAAAAAAEPERAPAAQVVSLADAARAAEAARAEAAAARAALTAAADPAELDRALARIAALETRLAEQEALLERVMRMMIGWLEGDIAPDHRHSAAA